MKGKSIILSVSWYLFSLLWLIHILLGVTLVLFRVIKTSGIARMIQFDDIPLFYALDVNYNWQYWGATCTGLAVFLILFVSYILNLRRSSAFNHQNAAPLPTIPWLTKKRADLLLVCFFGIALAAELWTNRYSAGGSTAGFTLKPAGLFDWLFVLALIPSTWLTSVKIASLSPSFDSAENRQTGIGNTLQNSVLKLSIILLISMASVFISSARAHAVFWDSKVNGGFDYAKLLENTGIWKTNLVLYSTSALFASIAALAGCLAYILFHTTSRHCRKSKQLTNPRDAMSHSWGIAFLYSVVLGTPWQLKLWKEIEAEGSWIFPAGILIGIACCLVPMICVCATFMRSDFLAPVDTERTRFKHVPRRSEFAFGSILLFPIYPVMRVFSPSSPIVRSVISYLTTALLLIGLLYSLVSIENWFDFEDWRGMLRDAQFPVMHVFLSLLAAYWIYLIGRRLGSAFQRFFRRFWPQRRTVTDFESTNDTAEIHEDHKLRPQAARPIIRTITTACILVITILCIGFSSLPFWGWRTIGLDVFARTCEHSDRHRFELGFLHWIFDADRDGYAAVLHGADLDDFDSNIQAGGLGPPQTVSIPLDCFQLVTPEKAAAFPNVLILYLEGVTPKSISAYGERSLPGGLKATPSIDRVAGDGTIFNNALCHYPSTWDAWLSINGGRFLRMEERDCAEPFDDRYSRYNNLYKVLDLIGIKRWCHADTTPYFDLFVPGLLETTPDTAWNPPSEFDSTVSPEEEEAGLTVGDKRTERMISFLESLKPGERFVITEHMSDTHFPFERTSPERAAELGFEKGLEIYEHDAFLSNGDSNEKLAKYYHSITRMDSQIGRILSKLDELGLYDDTLIVIVGDHGFQWWEHEHLYYVSHLYHQSLHIPMIVKVPGLSGGRNVDDPVLQVDVLPTVMELGGVEWIDEGNTPLPGVSLVPLMNGEATEEDKRLCRQRDMILTTHYDMLGVIENFRYKLIFERPFGTYLLFDLQTDPGEMVNIADDNPELLEYMLKKLRQLSRMHPALTGSIQR